MPDKKSNLPRKRPSQSRSLSTVEAVLEATARILEERDTPRVTTNAIAERAGVSIGSLYQYFPSRDAIFAEMIRRERTNLLNKLERVVADTSEDECDIDTAIDRFIAAAVAQQLDRPDVARALDRLEPTLMLEEETRTLETRIASVLTNWLDIVLGGDGASRQPQFGQDAVAIVKGIVDAAGNAGETDKELLKQRVARALRGYLEVS